jgi:hypothetical protein
MARIVDMSTFIEAAQSGVSAMDTAPASACSLNFYFPQLSARVVDLGIERQREAVGALAACVMGDGSGAAGRGQAGVGGGGGAARRWVPSAPGDPTPRNPRQFFKLCSLASERVTSR